jgi:hypothetical protein
MVTVKVFMRLFSGLSFLPTLQHNRAAGWKRRSRPARYHKIKNQRHGTNRSLMLSSCSVDFESPGAGANSAGPGITHRKRSHA